MIDFVSLFDNDFGMDSGIIFDVFLVDFRVLRTHHAKPSNLIDPYGEFTCFYTLEEHDVL